MGRVDSTIRTVKILRKIGRRVFVGIACAEIKQGV